MRSAHSRGGVEMLTRWDSPLTHHLAAATGSRPEPRGAADVHFGASEYVGENHKVRRPWRRIGSMVVGDGQC